MTAIFKTKTKFGVMILAMRKSQKILSKKLRRFFSLDKFSLRMSISKSKKLVEIEKICFNRAILNLVHFIRALFLSVLQC